MNEVFVYGILLRDGEPGETGESATVEGYRLAFYDGLATVEEAPGEHVCGAILSVTDEQLRRYDGIEGYIAEHPERGLYRRERVHVTIPWQGTAEAWIYIKNRNGEPEPPWTDMLASIHRGYLRWGHDDELLHEAVARARKEGAWIS